ncbi:hypothetical protein CIHG_06732 [Coccidioides immitis H538.4]|uniref:Uncharacterized protein n=1 Tax=Coccidioides immitis H538.4 TaxID=396776 RepID=A0A0J8RWH0_COCIT|nr:hypothetical protein CIHG_06732 [Coccidioides immitis H538.4]
MIGPLMKVQAAKNGEKGGHFYSGDTLSLAATETVALGGIDVADHTGLICPQIPVSHRLVRQMPVATTRIHPYAILIDTTSWALELRKNIRDNDGVAHNNG